MFKRLLIFAIFLMAIPALYFKTADLNLSYYVLSTFLLLPVFYLYTERALILFRFSVAIFFLLEIFFAFRMANAEVLLLTLGHAALILCLVFYRRMWLKHLMSETRKNEDLLKSSETLKTKHQNRVENLQHLEKQAASLMDLFEMARDFSEALSLDILCEQIFKKVKPELPFQEMILNLPTAGIPESTPFPCYLMNEMGVRLEETSLGHEDADVLRRALREKKMQTTSGGRWLFPLAIENETLAFFTVQGAEAGDLAKFEVLASHLVLQLKKIRLYETVRELSILDSLTQVFVRRHCLDLFENELKRSRKHGFSLALLMLDIDHFKRYNDDFGHLVGDATLREVAAILKASTRKVDIVARYGGEEFMIVIPETEIKGALEVAERIRSGIARNTFQVYDVVTKVTASIGVSVFPQDLPEISEVTDHSEAMKELIRKSDLALYRAKEEGRNRVVRYQDL